MGLRSRPHASQERGTLAVKGPRRGLAAVAVAMCLLLVLSLNTAYASPTAFSLGVTGGVVNTGNQTYSVSGGSVGYASVDGYTLDLPATLTFTISAQVTGLSTTGSASMHLVGTSGGGAHSIVVDAQISLDDMVAASDLPAGCTPGTDCTSALPFFFLGASTTTVTIDGSAGAAPNPPVFELESPYFNPWGGPIVLTSEDGSVVIVATYATGTIQWQGTQTSGAVTGTVGGSAVTGTLNIVSNESEDLVAGTASDSGTIALSGMSSAFLDVQGTYNGTSYIPAPGAGSDCSGTYGLPPGTCTETGFQSTGQATMQSGQVQVTGSYSTTWGVPALGYSSTLSLSYDYLPDPPVACTPAEIHANPGWWPTIGLDGSPFMNTPNATNTLSFYVTQPDAVPAAWLAGGCVSQDAASFARLNVTRVAFSVDGQSLQNATVSFSKHGEFECYTDASVTLIDDWRGCSGSISVVQVWSGAITFTVMPTGLHSVKLEAWGQGGAGPSTVSLVVDHSLCSYSGQPFVIDAQSLVGRPITVKVSGLEPMLTTAGIVMTPVSETYNTMVPPSGEIYGSFLPNSLVTIADQSPADPWAFTLGNNPQSMQQLVLNG